MGITIEWDSVSLFSRFKTFAGALNQQTFHQSGQGRKKPPASTVHGWLAKMRGTLVGDEALRSKGMREMEQARRNRGRRQMKDQAGNGFGLFSMSAQPNKKALAWQAPSPALRGHRPRQQTASPQVSTRTIPSRTIPSRTKPKTSTSPVRRKQKKSTSTSTGSHHRMTTRASQSRK